MPIPDLDLEVDPKLGWALRHPEQFPVDINKADYEMLLRVPGIGVKSAKLIVVSRRYSRLGTGQLKKMGVVMKKASISLHATSCQSARLTKCHLRWSVKSLSGKRDVRVPTTVSLSSNLRKNHDGIRVR